MNSQEIFELLSRWLHVIPAIILVGGTFFLRFVLAPLKSDNKEADNEAVRKKWARLVMISILCLLISGIYNGWLKTQGPKLSGLYVTLLLVKFLLAFVVFYFASVLSGRSKTAQKFREKEIFWLNVLCGLMLLLVAIAGFMKVSPDRLKFKTADPPAIEQAAQVGNALPIQATDKYFCRL